MRTTVLATIILAACLPAVHAQNKKERTKALNSIKVPDIKRHLFYLASDQMKGRESGTMDAHRAAVYIARHYRKFGLRPMGVNGGYFQPFTWAQQASNRGTYGKDVAATNWIEIQEDPRKLKFVTLSYNKDYRPVATSGTGYLEGKIVFAGYGITAQEHGYDDYAGLDAKDKIVVILSGQPSCKAAGSPWQPGQTSKHAELATKIENAKKHGARGLVITSPKTERKLPKSEGEFAWPRKIAPDKGDLPVVYATTSAADKLLRPLNLRPKSRADKINQTGKPQSHPTGSVSIQKWARARLRVSHLGELTGGFKNVIGFIEGTDPVLKKECLVLGGHYDHVGMGSFGSRGGKGRVHNGADDNASGTTGVLEIAQALQYAPMKRSCLVMAFDGEERGLLGSKYYVTDPVFPLKDTVAMFNMDMISRNGFKQIFIGASKRNPTIHGILEDINKKYKITLRFDGMDKYTNRSDQYAFLERGIPGIFFFGGIHNDYHTARDDPAKANFEKTKVISQLVFFVMYKVAHLAKRP